MHETAKRPADSKGRTADKTVLVTGSTGRLGKALVKELLAHGYSVRAYVEKLDYVTNLSHGVVPFIGDIADMGKLEEAVSGASYVFHLAAIVSEYKAFTEELVRVNVEGTAAVAEACARSGVKKMVFSSSVDVYGRRRDELLTEESAPKPSDKYGHTKVLAEREITSMESLNYSIFRIGAIYGKGFEHSFFKVFKAIKNGNAYIIGDGKNHFSLIHINDVVKGLILGMHGRNGIYNLTDGIDYTQKGLYDFAADALGAKRINRHISPVIVSLVAKRRGLNSDELRFITSNRKVSIAKIKKELGFKPSAKMEKEGREMAQEFIGKYGSA